MKKTFLLFFIVGLFCVSNTAHAAWYNSSWLFRKQITIDHTKIASSTSTSLANFPVLISLPSDAGLSANASSTGNDILFTGSDGSTKLNHEIESYVSASGTLITWVQVPLLSATSDTVLYMYYGNVGALNQQNATSTWNGGYKGVWHFSNGASFLKDSTLGASNLTNHGATATAGHIDGAANLVSGSQQFFDANAAASSLAQGDFTFSGWVNLSSTLTGGNNYTIYSLSDNPSSNDVLFKFGASSVGVDQRLNFCHYTTGSAFNCASSSQSSFIGGTWYYVAGTFSSSTGSSLFINGAQDGSENDTSRGNIPSTHLTLGSASIGSAYWFNGNMDELRVSNVARSADWIKTEFNNQSSPNSFFSIGSAINFDVTPPSVLLTNPANAAIASSTINISAVATDNIGISGVQFRLDGTNFGGEVSATSSPNTYSVPWDTSFSINGSHTLTAIAYDIFRNSSTSPAVTITVNNAVPSTPIISSFSASPGSVTAGFPSILSWNVMGATSVNIDNGLGSRPSSGSAVVAPLTTTTYTLTAANPNGNASSTATITAIPLAVPGAPTAVSSIVGNAQATVSFSAPVSNGGSAITQYMVTSHPGNITAVGSASPIVVFGLDNGTSYTFSVTATNIIGTSTSSSLSGAVIPNGVFTPWYNAQWVKRQVITVVGSPAGAQTDYQVKIAIPFVSEMKSDFSDIRFTDADGVTLLSYWLESKTDGVTATFWVKVPLIPAGPVAANVDMYYGNPAATSLSNGQSTFKLFDTFGSGNTPGDWNWSYNTIGEHGVIKNNKLYLPLEDQQTGANSGLVILNPSDGTVIKHFTIPTSCLESAPAIDKNGFIHVQSCAGFLKKIDENTGVVATLNIPNPVDWEAVTYDSVNDIILEVFGGVGLRAVKASDYTSAWTNTNVVVSGGSALLGPPLIVGPYTYFQDYNGKLFKIALADGTTVASTTAMVTGSPLDSYAQMIYDSANNRIYATNSTGHTAFAINASDLSVVWSKTIENGSWKIFRGGAYHNNVLYVNIRQLGFPFGSKLYALDTQNGGNILWTNTTPLDNTAQASSVLVDENYVYETTYDYANGTYSKFIVLNVADGTVAETVDLLDGVASSIPVVYGGKIIIGLWDTFGYQALQVRAGGGTGDYVYKADPNMTGYTGAFGSGPLTARTICDYPVLDSSKWTVTHFGSIAGYSIANCSGLSTTNASAWTNYITSSGTLSRAGTAVRVRAKSTEATGNSWDTYAGITNTIGTASPVSSGEFNGNVVFSYDQNGSVQTTTGPAYTKDQYNVTEVKMAYPNLQFDVNDVNIASTTGWSTAFDNVHLKLGNFTGRDVVDWALVRNYSYPEPAATLGAVTLAPTVSPVGAGGGSIYASFSGIASSATSTSAQIAWQTNYSIGSEVDYGTSTAYGSLVIDPAFTTSHFLSILGLTPQTLYHFRVKDPFLAANYSSDYTFTTLASAGFSVVPPPVLVSTSTPPGSGPGTQESFPQALRLINDRGTFYLIIDGVKHGITSPGLLFSYGLEFKDATLATAQDLALPQENLLLPGDGALVKSKKDPTVYLISQGQRYSFTSAKIFTALGFKFSSVLLVTDPELQALPIPAALISNGETQHLPGVDINSKGTIYWIGADNQLHPYPNVSVYNSWHLKGDFSGVAPANSADLALPVGADMQVRSIQ